MSKRQELINELQEYLDIEDTDNIALYPEEVQMCIEALEKQVPKKPKDIVTLEEPFDDEVNVKMGNCAICGYDVHSDISEYCPNCGRKQDWSEADG